ncbi:MAG: ABC transporter permease [Gemmatimonadota bacterium]
MSRPRSWRHLFRRDVRLEVDEELAFHLESRIRELVDRGVDPEEARRRTYERFGDIETPRREMLTITQRRERRMARSEWFNELRQDLGYALRALRSAPGFTLVALLTLTLGIGANTAIFTVVHSVLLESLPYGEPDRLVRVRTAYPNGENYSLSPPDFMSVVDDARTFSKVGAIARMAPTVLGLGEPREVEGAQVTKGFFSLLSVGLTSGRWFTDEEHTPGRNHVLIVSHGFAEQRLGGTSTALGRSLTIAGQPAVVVGVLAPGVQFPADAQLFSPVAYDSTFSSATAAGRRGEFLDVLARLRPDATPESAVRDVQRIGADLQARFQQTNDKLTFTAQPLTDVLLGDVRGPLFVLMGAVGFVLLVACANVANLLLARATARESELAVRAALGAGRGRLIRQLLTESLVLSGIGAGGGLLLAWWATRALVAAAPAELPRIDRVSIDATVVFFTIGIAALTGVLFGVLPALQATGERLSRSLREGGRGALSGARGKRIRSSLVVIEMALAVVLLVGAGLLIRSFLELTKVDPGFQPERAVAFRISLQGPAYGEPASRVQFFERLFGQLKSLPGVNAVGGVTGLPMSGGASMLSFSVDGAPPPPANIFPEIRAQSITPGYFEAMGGQLLRGRMLNDQDRVDAAPVILVNRAAIARWFPDGNPVGERATIGRSREIVGVVGDMVQTTPSEAAEPEAYIPYAQRPTRTLRIAVRSSADPMVLAPRIRETVRSLDPQLPLDAITPLSDVISASVARPRFYTTLLGIFAGLALALAVVGTFGVMSYMVAQRQREISVRMALGADGAQVVRMVVGGGLALAGIGLSVGVVGALAMGGVLRSQLFGVGVADPVTLIAVLVVLLASAGLASYLPARRAASVDPGMSLRDS